MGDILKKLLYILMVFIALSYIYNGYIKPKEDIVEIKENNDKIKTRNVKYDIGKDYEIEAETQTEDKKNDTTYFTVAKAFFENIELKGKEAFVDRYRNMILKGEIIGKNPDGWEIFTEEIKYDEKKEKFYSNTKLKAINEGEKIELESDNFESNKNFTVLEFSKNVKILSENYNLNCNRGIYDRNRKFIKVTENVQLRARNLDSDRGELKKITANFNQGIYNMDVGQFTSWGRFTIFYEGYVLKADNLIFFNNTGDINIYGDVVITKGDMQINLSKLYYNKDNQTMELFGPITGRNGDYHLKGDSGVIYTESEILKITGSVLLYNDKIKLNADEMEYLSKDNKLFFYSHPIKLLVLTGPDYRLTTKIAEFDSLNEILYLPKQYKYFKDDIIIEGDNLTFNTKTESGISNGNIATKESNKLYADEVKFDIRNRKHILSGRVRGKYENYNFNGDEALVDEEKSLVYTNKPFLVENLNDKLIVKGSEGTFFNNEKRIVIEKNAEFIQNDYKLNSDNLVYNIESESGVAKGKLRLVNEKDNMVVTGDEAILENRELLVKGAINYRMDENSLTTKEALYNLDEEKVYFNNPGTLINRKENMEVTYKTAIYFKNENRIEMDDFVGKKDGIDFKSNKAFYEGNERKFIMKEDAIIKKDKMDIKSSQLDYYSVNGDLISNDKLVIEEEGIKVVSKTGKINIKTKTLEGEDATLTTERGDVVTGDYITGEFLKKEFNFRGNLKGRMIDGVRFSGDMAKLYFVENMEVVDKIKSIDDVENDRFFLTRGEIKNNAKFEYRDIVLKAEFLELDLDKRIVFGEGTSVLKLDEETDITADYIHLNIDNESGNMENNVKITNKSNLTGVINTSSDRAELDNVNKKVKLIGNVVSYQGKTKIMANEGIYDVNTKELHGQGNIQLKYNIESTPANKKEQKREELIQKEIEERRKKEGENQI